MLSTSLPNGNSNPPDTCNVQLKNDTSSFDKDESGWIYTQWMSAFMHWLVDGVDENTIRSISKVIAGKVDAGEVIGDLLFKNSGVVLILAVLCLFAVGLLAATVIVCLMRWLGSSAKEGKEPSKGEMVYTLISFCLCGVACFAGVFLFNQCLTEMRSGVESITTTLNGTARGLDKFVGSYGQHLVCIFDKEEHTLMKTLNKSADNIYEVIDRIDSNVDSVLVRNTSTLIQEIGHKVIVAGTLPGADELNNLAGEMDKLKEKLEKNRQLVKDQLKKTASAVSGQREALQKVVSVIEEKSGEIQKIIQQVIKNNPFNEISFYMQFLSFIPFLLFLIMAFGFILLSIRFLCNCCGDQLDPTNPKRGSISTVAGHILGVGGYSAMLSGAMLFAIAAVCFLLAFVSMFLCISLFEDPGLRVFAAIPDKSIKVGNKGSAIVSVHDTFVKCKNNFSFFDAINGDVSMAKAELSEELKRLRNNDFALQARQFVFPGELYQNIEKALSELKDQNNQDADFERLKRNLEKLSDQIKVLNSRTERDLMCLTISDSQKEMETAIIKALAELFKALMDLSPQCGNLMSIWNKIGAFICQKVSRPTQGAWMAAVICGIGSISVFRSMFQGTKYLKNFHDSEQESKDKKRSTEQEEESDEPVERRRGGGGEENELDEEEEEEVKEEEEEEEEVGEETALRREHKKTPKWSAKWKNSKEYRALVQE